MAAGATNKALRTAICDPPVGLDTKQLPRALEGLQCGHQGVACFSDMTLWIELASVICPVQRHRTVLLGTCPSSMERVATKTIRRRITALS